MKVAQILKERAEEFPEKPAIIFKDKAITFRDLKLSAFKFADSLISLGAKKGDKFAIYLPNCPEYISSYLAAFCCGLTCVPLDFMLTEDELISCISHSEANILVAQPKTGVSFPKIKENCPGLKQIIPAQEKLEGVLFFEEVMEKGSTKLPAASIRDEDYAIIFYTSGTTGRPKGVLINYRQLSAPPQAMTHFVDFTDKDILLCALPFSHLGGLIYLQNCISFGMTTVIMERFLPLEFLRNIPKYGVTCLWIVPSMYYALLQSKEFESCNLSSLRWIVIFGAPSSPDALRRFYQYCPKAELLHGWGLTETNAPTTVIPLGSRKVESVGKSAPWIEVKVFDEKDLEVGPGGIGEIAVKGWVVTDGYYKDPETTKQAIRNGWFYTGDLGWFDAEGYLYIVGRKKEMIKVAGEIVFEPEVEAALYKHPDVVEAAVIGVPDKLRGEVPKAFLVLKEAARAREDELRYFCRQHLAHFKVPHYFEFTSSLPKNRTGKIDKEKLRAGILSSK